MNKTESKTVIIGGGITGLSVAYHLNLNGLSYRLFEKSNALGGLCKTKIAGDFLFDYTGHFFHFKSDYGKELVADMLGDNLGQHDRNIWIYCRGNYVQYPFEANLHALPKHIREECVEEFKKAHETYKNKESYRSFKEWIQSTLGEGIGRYFMYPYNEKLWTVPTDEMTCEWMGRFVPRYKPEEILRGAEGPQGKSFGYNKILYYPKRGGIQAFIDAMSENIPNINMTFAANKISIQEKTVLFSTEEEMPFNKLISTIPLPRLIQMIEDCPVEIQKAADKLRYASVLNINLGIARANISDKHWIYFPDREYPFTRTGFLSNFSDNVAPKGCSSVYLEISYVPGDLPDEGSISKLAIEKLQDAGILKNSSEVVEIDINKLEYAYVIYDHNYRKSVDTIQCFLKEHGIISLGRYGNWEYSSMEDALLAGKNVSEEILQGK